MSFRLYKEGQGRWARGALASIVFLVGLFASISLSQWFDGNGWGTDVLFTIPFLNIAIQTQSLLPPLILVPFLLGGYWYYNQSRVSDFLIDTEHELQHKVTWPTRQETVKNSIVVVITCIVIMGWIVLADQAFKALQTVVYH
ncbi:MAG: preprotein translocase subunit SecE [Planctomycetota bacterium]|jgi:preprotein translocase SecE subunit|nr:preprotein translocase subunit SecE [Planctomycetota bacterium]